MYDKKERIIKKVIAPGEAGSNYLQTKFKLNTKFSFYSLHCVCLKLIYLTFKLSSISSHLPLFTFKLYLLLFILISAPMI